VGDLGGEFVPGERRDQAEHSIGNLESDGDQVRVAERRSIRQSVQPPAEQFDPTGIAESVQSPGMDTRLQSLARAQHPPVSAEMIQRRCDRAGFFERVFDAHADKYTITITRVPVFLSMSGQDCEKAKTDCTWCRRPPRTVAAQATQHNRYSRTRDDECQSGVSQAGFSGAATGVQK